MKIDINKKYKTVNGLEVDILKIYPEDSQEYPVKAYIYHYGNLDAGICEDYTIDGRFYSDSSIGIHERDLVEVSPYKDFKIDDKVIVWDVPEHKHKRYFAGVSEDGRPLTFSRGTTSWSNPGGLPVPWDYCIKYVEEK